MAAQGRCTGRSGLPRPRGLCLCSRRWGSSHGAGVEDRGGAGPVGEGRPWKQVSLRWAHRRDHGWSSLRGF